MRICLFFVWWLFAYQLNAQVEVAFQLMYSNRVCVLNDTIVDSVTQEKIVFKTVKFYISYPELINGEVVVCSDPKQFHLIDLEHPESMNWTIPCTPDHFSAFRFGFGIDSLTNVSGAFGDDLDPVNGMYWSWQSGYINCKLEGYASFSSAKDPVFEYHLGGYSGAQKSFRMVVLPTGKSPGLLVLLDLEAFFRQVDAAKLSHLMSPSETASMLSLLLSQSFE